MFKLLALIFLSILITNCQEVVPTKVDNRPNASNIKFSKTSEPTTTEVEIQLLHSGDDIETDRETPNYKVKKTFENRIELSGFGSIQRVELFSELLENSGNENSEVEEKFRKFVLEEASYTNGGLLAKFNGEDENIEVDENFLNAINILTSNGEQVALLANNNTLTNYKNLPSKEYIKRLKADGFNVNQLSDTEYEVSQTINTQLNEDPIVITSTYNTQTAFYDNHKMYFNGDLMYESNVVEHQGGVLKVSTKQINTVDPNRDAQINTYYIER